jgi:hypothetical protein
VPRLFSSFITAAKAEQGLVLNHYTKIFLALGAFLLGCGQAPQSKKMVLFEFFGRQACGICKNAGPVANELLHEYESKGLPVLMLGSDVGPPGEPSPDIGGRRARWREVFGNKQALLPLILLQSGNDITQGSHSNFREKYDSMIQAAANIAPTAELEASYQRDQELFLVKIRLENIGTDALDPSQKTSLKVFFYDDQRTMHLDHTTRAIETLEMPRVEPNQTLVLMRKFTLPESIDADSLHVAVIAEYQDKDGKWQIAQGTLAKEAGRSALEEMLAFIW